MPKAPQKNFRSVILELGLVGDLSLCDCLPRLGEGPSSLGGDGGTRGVEGYQPGPDPKVDGGPPPPLLFFLSVYFFFECLFSSNPFVPCLPGPTIGSGQV